MVEFYQKYPHLHNQKVFQEVNGEGCIVGRYFYQLLLSKKIINGQHPLSVMSLLRIYGKNPRSLYDPVVKEFFSQWRGFWQLYEEEDEVKAIELAKLL